MQVNMVAKRGWMRVPDLVAVLSFSSAVGWTTAGCADNSTVGNAPADEATAMDRLRASDIDRLAGEPWIGTLTYKDYTSGRSTTIESSFMARRLDGEGIAWEFGYGYSKEPHADAKEVVRLCDDGRTLGEERVIAVEHRREGTLWYVTEAKGEDDGRPAVMRFEHSLTPTQFSRRKLVRFDGDADFFERHVYRWSR